jgi:flagellar biosynthesis/type III secretory pathway protein FliH
LLEALEKERQRTASFFPLVRTACQQAFTRSMGAYVRACVERIVHAKACLHSDFLQTLLAPMRSALEDLSVYTLFVAPQEEESVLILVRKAYGDHKAPSVCVDPLLAPGSCRVEGPCLEIDASLSARIEMCWSDCG